VSRDTPTDRLLSRETRILVLRRVAFAEGDAIHIRKVDVPHGFCPSLIDLELVVPSVVASRRNQPPSLRPQRH